MHRTCVLNWKVMKTTQPIKDEIANVKQKMKEDRKSPVPVAHPVGFTVGQWLFTSSVRNQVQIRTPDPMDKVREPLPAPDRRSFRQKHGGSRWPQK